MTTAKLRFVFAAALAAVACKDRRPYESPPPDLPPTIQRIAPTAPSALALPGASLSLNFLLADNERLARFSIEERILTNVRY
ncbi:MAG: hypothetical protein RMM53_11880, partial [Bacteroidia bacterium]|nr:hypothetical protein [Bacteroidia bacterium]